MCPKTKLQVGIALGAGEATEMAKTFTQTAKNNGRRALITRQKQKEGDTYRQRERERESMLDVE